MTLNPRQSQIVAALERHGALTIESLAAQFGVTVQTLRRDVTLLEEAGKVARYHGGVQLPTSTTENAAYHQRQQSHAEAKRAIARLVAAAVPNGCSILLNIGTTTEAVARELLGHRNLRVVTNNLNVAGILAANPHCEVIVAGGLVRPQDGAVIGELTVDFIRQFKVDLGLIGISGVESDGTLRDFDHREVRTARAIIEQSRQVWLVADQSKFHRPAMVRLAGLDEIDRLFTDSPPPEPFDRLLMEAGVAVEIAPPTGQVGSDAGR
jgi:DeoR family glycerol-3-phosphate regulon repressor